jgi:hypothetical protein
MHDAEHRVEAVSIAHFQLKVDSGAPYFLQADMSSPRDIIAFHISFTKPEKEIAQRTYADEARARGSAQSTTSCCPTRARQFRRPLRHASHTLLMRAGASCATATLSSPRRMASASLITAAHFNSRQKKRTSTPI